MNLAWEPGFDSNDIKFLNIRIHIGGGRWTFSADNQQNDNTTDNVRARPKAVQRWEPT